MSLLLLVMNLLNKSVHFLKSLKKWSQTFEWQCEYMMYDDIWQKNIYISFLSHISMCMRVRVLGLHDILHAIIMRIH